MKKFDNPLDEMLYILSKECEQPIPNNLTDYDKRYLINMLMVIRTPGYLDERFLELQDEILKKESNEKCYDFSLVKFKKHFALTRRDITDLKIDAICCETMSIVGNMIPNIKCLDNQILLKGGLQIREECNKFNDENKFIVKYGSAFCVSGYNLPANNVIKLILPHIDLCNQYYIDKISNAIVSALDIIRAKKINKFAINISIDKRFNISNEIYSYIVVFVVSKYIKEHKYKLNCLLVVDNDEDENMLKSKYKIKNVF